MPRRPLSVRRFPTVRFLAVLLWAAVAGCAGASAPATTTHVYPGAEGWEHWPDPGAAGFSSAGLEDVRAGLQELGSSAMLVVKGGRVVFDYGDLAEVSYLASVRKTILAMLYGPHVADGTIDLDRTLAELEIDDVQGLTDAEKQATVRHVISARSGIFHPASNSGDDLASAPERGSQPPGSYQLYSNWDFNAAGTLFEVQTGRNLFDALESDLAVPIGFEDFDRERHVKGGNLDVSIHPSYHMHLSTRDMARVGYLLLREGRWEGRQLIAPEWIREMTGPVTPVHEMNPARRRDGPHGYGYMTWVWDGAANVGPYRGAYTGVGAVGQYITVLPALDLVVAHKTVPGEGRGVQHPRFWELLDRLVAAHCGEDC